jgi:Flp pilus assembly secretin CpaC
MQNFTARLEGDDGYCTLDSSILAENETSESVGTALVQAFDRGKDKLDFWRDVTNEMYPTQPQFAAMIPQSSELTLTKNRLNWKTSDTCNTALKLQRILTDLMKQ